MASYARALIHDLDYSQDPVEEGYRRGWTDGMPVAPPTVEKVNQMPVAEPESEELATVSEKLDKSSSNSKR